MRPGTIAASLSSLFPVIACVLLSNKGIKTPPKKYLKLALNAWWDLYALLILCIEKFGFGLWYRHILEMSEIFAVIFYNVFGSEDMATPGRYWNLNIGNMYWHF